MWHITLLFFNDKNHFLNEPGKASTNTALCLLLRKVFDTATAIRRLQDNASDEFSGSCRPTNGDAPSLTRMLIVTTGEKTETLCEQFSLEKPKVGDFTSLFLMADLCGLYTNLPLLRIFIRLL